MNRLQDNSNDRQALMAIVLTAFCMPFLTGFLGMMPLDQSIIFEAAGRMQHGDKLFDDFGISYGLIPVLLQSLLFSITGVNWFAYVLHAAIFNAFFAWIVMDLLTMLVAGNRRTRYLASLLIAWSFYPMFGTAFLDNHSFFFGFAAWWIVIRSFHSGKFHLLLLCGPLLALGYYSKPLPSIFWLIPVLFELVVRYNSFKSYLKWMIGSFVAGAITMVLPVIVFDQNSFFYYTFRLPYFIGKERLGGAMPGRVTKSLRDHYKIWVPTFAFLILLLGMFPFPGKKNNGVMWGRLIVILIVTIITAGITANAFNNNTAPIFIFVFFVSYNLYCDGNIQRKRILRWVVGGMFAYYLIYISIYNVTRRVHDIVFTTGDLKNYSRVLGVFLKTEHDLYSIEDIDRLSTMMQSTNTLYIGDLFCMYSLTKQNNPWPISHIHDGTSYASRDDQGYIKLKMQLLENCRRNQVNKIIQDVTWHRNEPLVTDLQVLKGTLTESFGNISVFELDAGALEKMLNDLKSKVEK